MFASVKLVALALSAMAVAAPHPEKRAIITYNDNYDDLPSVVIAPQLSPVGVYHGLSYKGAVVVPPQVPGFSDLKPHSPPNAAGAAGPLDLLQLGTVTFNAYIQITRAPGVLAFDLTSFWFGLATDDGTSDGIAQGGTIAVTGYDFFGNVVPTASFSYAPEALENAPLTFASLPPSYRNLQNVSIGIAVSEPVTERTYLQVDNLIHTNYS